MIDFITSLFELKDTDVDYCKEVIKGNNHLFYIQLINRGKRCIDCGTYTRYVKEYRNKRISHSVLLNEPSTIIYHARRFVCPKCNATFYEDNPFSTQYTRISDDTVRNTLQLLKNYNETFASVGRKVYLSKTLVMQIFDEHVQVERGKLSTAIGIDEFYFSRHARKKYALMILSLNKGYVIDLLSSREKHKISSYFRSIDKNERLNVQYISIDMTENYRNVLKIYFPWAKICVDPFHVIKLISDALDQVRLRYLRKYKADTRSDEYYLLKYQKRLLFKEIQYQKFSSIKRNHHFKYTLTDYQKREMIFSISHEIETAWHLKERYLLFDEENLSHDERSEWLDSLINDFISSDIPEMISVGLTLSNWKEEILNSFYTITKTVTDKNGKKIKKTVRVTSGPVEGRNKYLKIILKLANGYKNFGRFRNRAMYVLNVQEEPSNHRLPNNVKMIYKKKE